MTLLYALSGVSKNDLKFRLTRPDIKPKCHLGKSAVIKKKKDH